MKSRDVLKSILPILDEKSPGVGFMQSVSSALRILVMPVVFLISVLIFAESFPNPLAQSRNQKGVEYVSEVKVLPEHGKRVALIIGINEYDDNQIKKLVGAVNDARGLKDALMRSAGFDEGKIILLASDEKDPSLRPTLRNIYVWLGKLRYLVPKDGLLLFAFSGHGISSDDGQAFLLPSDASMSTDKNLLKRFAVPVTDVADYIKNTGVRQMIMLLDACRNNPAGKGEGDSSTVLTEAFTRPFDFQKRNGNIDALVTVYATQPGQRAWENQKTNRGYFMETVIEGINGAARNPATGEVTLESFRKYVEDNVLKRTMREPEPQKPRFLADGYNGELVIAKVAPSDSEAAARSEWERIQYAGAKADFDSYLKRFPKSKYAEYASWELIRASSNRDDFKTYINNYPQGKYYGDAAKKAEDLLWDQARSSKKPADYQAYLKEYPDGRYADSANAKLRPVEPKPPSEQVAAKSMNAMLLVLTNPPKANVIVRSKDGKGKPEQGQSDADGKFRRDLPLGLYEIEVSAAKYDAKKIDSFKLDAGADPLKVDLPPLTGTILITPVEVSATVFVDNQEFTSLQKRDKAIELTDVPIGKHKVRVKQRDSSTYEKEVIVVGGSQAIFSTDFRAALGDLIISTEPRSDVYIDGAPNGKTDSNGELVIKGLALGDHNLRVQRDGFDEKKVAFKISTGDNKVPVTLSPIVSSGDWDDQFSDLDNWDAPVGWKLNREEGNKYVLVSGTKPGFAKARYYGDFTWKFDIRLGKSKTAAWVVRARDENKYYLFVLDCSQGSSARFYTYLYEDGKLEKPKSVREYPRDLGHPGDQLHIKVTAAGDRIEHQINVTGKYENLDVFTGARALSIGRIGFRAKDENGDFALYNIQCYPGK